MKILMHVCCAPCFIYPYLDLQKEKIQITGYFYNPNIHPYKEFERRLDTLKDFSEKEKIDFIYDEGYGLEYFLTEIFQNKKEDRCDRCYKDRLVKTVKEAKEKNADAFTTSMLLSPYQDHDRIIEIAKDLSEQYDIEFYYKDWRPYYKESISLSKERNFYRQPYCGCVFSEEERYLKKY
ncbi:epoxyqueuosine reductase QueH [bacterium]|nr:epoxyqueuosine reductase QueH [bacterium]